MATFVEVRNSLKERGYTLGRTLERYPPYYMMCSRCGSYAVAHPATLSGAIQEADQHDTCHKPVATVDSH